VDALIVVDVQNDFMPYGALPVAEGDAVVPVINGLMPEFELVVATQDWHPPEHGSFASNHPGRETGETVELGGVEQVLWPDHCVQDTPGAAFHSRLDVARVDAVVRKGTDPGIDSYSAFFDNGHLRDTGLANLLRSHNATRVFLAGLATDYCVKYSALDALAEGFETLVVRDGCRAVDLEAGDGQAAFVEMGEAGCSIVHSGEIAAST
jgi:nicotinamidase/pyrazinamidase